MNHGAYFSGMKSIDSQLYNPRKIKTFVPPCICIRYPRLDCMFYNKSVYNMAFHTGKKIDLSRHVHGSIKHVLT